MLKKLKRNAKRKDKLKQAHLAVLNAHEMTKMVEQMGGYDEIMNRAMLSDEAKDHYREKGYL